MDMNLPTEIGSDDVYTVHDIKKRICDIEKNQRLYDQIILVKPGNNEALDDDKKFHKYIRNTRKSLNIYEVRMKNTNKWYIEDKFEKLCHGYCNEIAKETKLNIPMYLRNIVLNYCPKYNETSLFHI